MKSLIQGKMLMLFQGFLFFGGVLSGALEDELIDGEDFLVDEEDPGEAFDAVLPTWEWSAYVRSSLGYADNVLMSSVNPRSDNYLRTELDFFLWKLPTEHGDGYLYINGVDVRFDDLEGADKEQVWLGDVRWNQYLGDSTTGYIELLYLYQDQVIDFSESLFYSFREQVRSHRYGPIIGVKQLVGERHEVDFNVKVYREEYQSLLDNQWKPGAELEWMCSLWENWEIGSRVQWERRIHDDRLARDDRGDAIDGLSELVDQKRWWLLLEHPVWPGLKSKVRWELGETWQRDNGGGFLDFDRDQVQLYIEGGWRGWEALISAGWSESRYREQQLSMWDATLRKKRDRFIHAEVSHQLTDRGRIFAACEFNETEGNLDSDNFSDLRIHVGLQIYLERIFAKHEEY